MEGPYGPSFFFDILALNENRREGNAMGVV